MCHGAVVRHAMRLRETLNVAGPHRVHTKSLEASSAAQQGSSGASAIQRECGILLFGELHVVTAAYAATPCSAANMLCPAGFWQVSQRCGSQHICFSPAVQGVQQPGL